MFSKVFFGRVLSKMPDGRTLLEFLVNRIKATEIAENIVLVTSDQELDLAIVEEGHRLGINVIRGPLDDLIKRLIIAADTLEADYLVRILGSNPLLDLEAMHDLVDAHFSGDWEYTYNDHFDGVMLGTGSEIVNTDLLRKIDKEKLTQEQRISGTLFIRQHSNRFKVQKFKSNIGMQWVSLGVDTHADLERITKIVNNVPT